MEYGPQPYQGQRIPYGPGSQNERYETRVDADWRNRNGDFLNDRYPAMYNQTPYRRLLPLGAFGYNNNGRVYYRDEETRPRTYAINDPNGRADWFTVPGFVPAILNLQRRMRNMGQTRQGTSYQNVAALQSVIDESRARLGSWLRQFLERSMQARRAVRSRVAEVNSTWAAVLATRRYFGADVGRVMARFMNVTPARLGLHMEGRREWYRGANS